MAAPESLFFRATGPQNYRESLQLAVNQSLSPGSTRRDRRSHIDSPSFFPMAVTFYSSQPTDAQRITLFSSETYKRRLTREMFAASWAEMRMFPTRHLVTCFSYETI